MFTKTALFAAAASLVAAQRPADTPICDYYTTALLKENNATNQYTLLTLLVNTAVIGNYTMPNVGVAVPGILNPNGTYEGRPVNLVPYFSGALASTNRGGMAVSVNFLDGGGAEPLMKNMAANDESSRQYTLLTHLYEYFGSLLGCTMLGMEGFPAYAGSTNMGKVHQFMDLSHDEVSYFIQQVGLSAASFGVTQDDVAAVGKALDTTFNYRCLPPASVPSTAAPAPQSICQAMDCPIAANASCDSYPTEPEPSTVASSSMMMATGTANMTSSMGGSATSPTGTAAATYTGAAAKVVAGVAAVGAAAFAAVL